MSNAANEDELVLVDDALALQDFCNVDNAGVLRNVDDLVRLQRTGRLEPQLAEHGRAAATDHQQDQQREDRIANDHERIADALRAAGRHRHVFRLQGGARAARRNPSVHIRIAESFCAPPRYGRVTITDVKHSRRTGAGTWPPSPGSRRTGECTHRIGRDRRLGRRRQAIVDAVGRRWRLAAAARSARQRRLRGWCARRRARRRARRACFGCGRARLPWRHHGRPCRRRARLVAQRRIGHRGREAAARRNSAWDSMSSAVRSWVSSAAAASARCHHHLEASFANSRSVPNALDAKHPERHPPQPAAQSGKLNRRRCSQSFGLRTTKISARRSSPTDKVEANMAKAGSLVI